MRKASLADVEQLVTLCYSMKKADRGWPKPAAAHKHFAPKALPLEFARVNIRTDGSLN